MHFVYPAILFGLSSVLIPIIVHLFNFRKTKIVYFTDIKYLQQVKESSSQRLKLKHLLILLSRILFLIFLVLIFAQPYIPVTKNNDRSNENVISLYIDNSFSMSNLALDGTLLQQAFKKTSEILSSFPSGTRFQLLTNEFLPESQALMNHNEAKTQLSGINYTPVYKTLNEIYQRQKQTLLPMSNSSKTIIWLGDFQKSTYGDLKDIVPDTSINLMIFPVQSTIRKNIFVDTVYFQNPAIRVNDNNVLTVRLYNDSKEDAMTNLKVLLDSVQVASLQVSIQAQSSTLTTFNISPFNPLWKKGKLVFTDYPVTFDNEYFFSFKPSQTINILCLENDTMDNYIGKVYKTEPFFKFSHFTEKALDYSMISGMNFIILNGINGVNDILSDQIISAIESGINLAIIPPSAENFSKPNLQTITSHLGLSLSYKYIIKGEIKDISDKTILPYTQEDDYRNIEIDSSDESSLQLLSPIDYKSIRNNPFFADVFESRLTGSENIDLPRVSKRMFWKVSGNLLSQDLIKFKDNEPFLTLVQKGKSKIFLFSSELSGNESNFSRHSLFVPIMIKLALESINPVPIAYSLQSGKIELKTESKEKDPVFKLTGNGFEIIPVQQYRNNKLFIEISKDDILPGHYQLNDREKTILSLNYGKLESYQEVIPTEEIEKILGKHSNVYVNTDPNSDAGKYIKEMYAGKPLWTYCLSLSLFFLLCEILLIKFYK